MAFYHQDNSSNAPPMMHQTTDMQESQAQQYNSESYPQGWSQEPESNSWFNREGDHELFIFYNKSLEYIVWSFNCQKWLTSNFSL